jgi:hypothetical protein
VDAVDGLTLEWSQSASNKTQGVIMWIWPRPRQQDLHNFDFLSQTHRQHCKHASLQWLLMLLRTRNIIQSAELLSLILPNKNINISVMKHDLKIYLYFYLVESKTITRLIVLCFVSSATSAAIVATHVYSAVGVFGVYSSQSTVESWPWWILQTFLRTEELISMCVVLTIASNSEQLKDFLGGCCRRANTRVKPISLKQDTGGNHVVLLII